MTITREQVADLIGGDVVELHRQGWAADVVVRGTLRADSCAGEIYLGDYSIFSLNGNEPEWLAFPGTTLTVVSRAPRPLYVNHDRAEPVAGDVARPEKRMLILLCRADHEWVDKDGGEWPAPPRPLRLLVDGSTGEVVQ